MMAHGHIIPTLDMAKLFASRRGIKSTVVTTPYNQTLFTKAIEKHAKLGHQMQIRSIDFPGVQVGLPENCQRLDQIPSPDALPSFIKACGMLQQPLEQLLDELRPDCLVADMLFPWATMAAAKFDIPRLVFHGTCCFSLCALYSLRIQRPFENVSSDSELFTIPDLPHQVKLTRLHISPHDTTGGDGDDGSYMTEFMREVGESEETSYGVIINSFYELEPDYAEHYRNVLGRRSWFVGPLSLQNGDVEDKADRGKKPSMDARKCMEWLDTKKPNSVVYVCFGSIVSFPPAQLQEMAAGIEASGQEFVWVIRNPRAEEEEKQDEWMPEGYEERMKGKGMIIRGWAPQLLILEHGAVGAFVTHCGWNSTLEAVCAGVSMVTWPAFADQFLNEKLVTEILRAGVGVGSKEWTRWEGVVKREAIAERIRRVMVGEESEGMRSRAQALKARARKAIDDEEGSSCSDLSRLLDELRAYHAA
ncbi:unnamed protein product [Cuscuta campestris]|uniref:Glycosyltransferase n=1 Tax=Cuscuta campestris TaxID=132261 RepID=A0A484LP58_9ASTE|nr:unnamed protein product [Cuscuta campestris]